MELAAQSHQPIVIAGKRHDAELVSAEFADECAQDLDG
jgi:hypothetical protein